jgi:hypothetical protein
MSHHNILHITTSDSFDVIKLLNAFYTYEKKGGQFLKSNNNCSDEAMPIYIASATSGIGHNMDIVQDILMFTNLMPDITFTFYYRSCNLSYIEVFSIKGNNILFKDDAQLNSASDIIDFCKKHNIRMDDTEDYSSSYKKL